MAEVWLKEAWVEPPWTGRRETYYPGWRPAGWKMRRSDLSYNKEVFDVEVYALYQALRLSRPAMRITPAILSFQTRQHPSAEPRQTERVQDRPLPVRY